MAEKEKKEKDPGEVTLKRVLISFPHVVAPQEGKVDKDTGKKGKPRFNSSFLIRKDRKDLLDQIKAAVKRVQLKKYGSEKNIPKYKPDRLAYRNGDLESWEGYEGCIYVSTSSPETRPPKLLDRDKSEISGADAARRFYGGAEVDAVVRFWVQDDPEYGKRVNCSVEAVRFVKNGPAFGANPVDVDEAFDDLGDDEDDDDGDGGSGESFDSSDDDDLLG